MTIIDLAGRWHLIWVLDPASPAACATACGLKLTTAGSAGPERWLQLPERDKCGHCEAVAGPMLSRHYLRHPEQYHGGG